MDAQPLEQVVRNIDTRLARVEQILPTLATKAELAEAIAGAIAPLATKAELTEAIAEAVAPLATKAELAAAIAPLATKAELNEAIAATKAELRGEIRQEGEHTRRHFDVVAERLEGHIRLLAEGQAAIKDEVAGLRTEFKADIAQLDRRVMRLEVARRV
jgi:hypothetical protein